MVEPFEGIKEFLGSGHVDLGTIYPQLKVVLEKKVGEWVNAQLKKQAIMGAVLNGGKAGLEQIGQLQSEVGLLFPVLTRNLKPELELLQKTFSLDLEMTVQKPMRELIGHG